MVRVSRYLGLGRHPRGHRNEPGRFLWQFWALLSPTFAALTAIFAKVCIENINSDFATLIRTAIILIVFAAVLAASASS
ncbi:putative membrane protein [Mesorhizobium sangaii]|uniref:Putative membrane protein n=1 Tax=Mesorhizobium sangaii TaxID=505389 RepID=A0A841PKL0_9HYPH|nr:putative membrane protein [Mesorhizobium sangaii]